MQLNCDLGEIPWQAGQTSIEAHIMPLIDQASIACGGHAGDQASMQRCVDLALQHGVSIGAHPSYPDKHNFGRKSIAMPAESLADCISEQIATLQSVCDAAGARIDYVKAHGALYNDMAHSPTICQVIIETVAKAAGKPALMHFAGLTLAQAPLKLIAEAFVDRRYTAQGLLQARALQGAVLTEQEMLLQAQLLCTQNQVVDNMGQAINIVADSLCVHGDNPAATRCIKKIRAIVNAA